LSPFISLTQKCKEPTHLALYLKGSEGITVCLNCRMALTEYVRQLQSIATVARKQGYLLANNRIHSTSKNTGE
jgi:hypothetical protein